MSLNEKQVDVKKTPLGLGLPSGGIGASNVSKLLQSLEEVAAESCQAKVAATYDCEDQLAKSRLGVAIGLFNALRFKHSPTASHCLRVAISSSLLARALDLPVNYREAIEVAALLHDIGKIGVPDHILLKPTKLLPEEVSLVAKHRKNASSILSSCCSSQDVLTIIQNVASKFSGADKEGELSGKELPIGSRVIAIADAFDAMTTDHIYRPAMTKERAINELFANAGTQFDPALVKSFHDLQTNSSQNQFKNVASNWLQQLQTNSSSIKWGIQSDAQNSVDEAEPKLLFESKLIESMRDGVVFVDTQAIITQWNYGMERMVGIESSAAVNRHWRPALLKISDESGKAIKESECLVTKTIATGTQTIQRINIHGRNGHHITVDMHVIPVKNNYGSIHGATILLRDASPEASLQARCQTLHDQATKDSLTQVANRAEFDRLHQQYIDTHLESGIPYSLIIADIDHFKNVNDTFGHQAGDSAIIKFSTLLTDLCRAGDLVARYGGEEFVILCCDCNNVTASKKANGIRQKLSERKIPEIGNRAITASFGVTELQPGDTPESMLRRADRGLLQAKDRGRNQVVQMGEGMTTSTPKKGWWPFSNSRQSAILETNLVTIVPMEVAIQKLRGFIADQLATITLAEEEQLTIEIDGKKAGEFRRDNDRPIAFSVDLYFKESRVTKTNTSNLARGEYIETHVHVVVKPKKSRDRRSEQASIRARKVMASLKSYLMAKELSVHEKEHPKPIDTET